MAIAREQIERLRAALSTEKKFQAEGNTLLTVFSDLNTYLVNGSLSLTSLLTMVKSIQGGAQIANAPDRGALETDSTLIADPAAPDIQFSRSAMDWVKLNKESIPVMSSKIIKEASTVSAPLSELVPLSQFPQEMEALNMINIGSKFSRFLSGASQVVISVGMGYIASQVLMFAVQHYDQPDLVLNFSGNVAGQMVAGILPYVVAESIGSEFLLLVAGDAILRSALGIPSQAESEEKARQEMEMTLRLRDIHDNLAQRQRVLRPQSYEYAVLGWMLENTRNIYDRVTPGPPAPTPAQSLDGTLHALSYMLNGDDSLWSHVNAITNYSGEYRFWVGKHLFQISRKQDLANYLVGTGPVKWEEIVFLLYVPQSGYIPVPQKRFDRGQIPPDRARDLNIFLASCDGLAAKLDGRGYFWGLRKAEFGSNGFGLGGINGFAQKINKRYQSFENIFRAIYPDFDRFFNLPFFPAEAPPQWYENRVDYDDMR